MKYKVLKTFLEDDLDKGERMVPVGEIYEMEEDVATNLIEEGYLESI